MGDRNERTTRAQMTFYLNLCRWKGEKPDPGILKAWETPFGDTNEPTKDQVGHEIARLKPLPSKKKGDTGVQFR